MRQWLQLGKLILLRTEYQGNLIFASDNASSLLRQSKQILLSIIYYQTLLHSNFVNKNMHMQQSKNNSPSLSLFIYIYIYTHTHTIYICCILILERAVNQRCTCVNKWKKKREQVGIMKEYRQMPAAVEAVRVRKASQLADWEHPGRGHLPSATPGRATPAKMWKKC